MAQPTNSRREPSCRRRRHRRVGLMWWVLLIVVVPSNHVVVSRKTKRKSRPPQQQPKTKDFHAQQQHPGKRQQQQQKQQHAWTQWRLPWEADQNETVVESSSSSSNHHHPSTSRLLDSVQTIVRNWYQMALGLPATPIQNVWDGLKLAVQAIWKSYFSGFDAALFQFPQEGYQKWGVPGIVAGTAFGLGHWCLQMTGGVLMAASHVACGLLLTNAHNYPSSDEGWIWSVQEQTWKPYSLDQDKATVDEMLSSLLLNLTGTSNSSNSHGSSKQQRQSSHSNLRKRKQVKDPFYYQVLDVSVGASVSEIKRAYHKQALQLHPDKNRNTDTTSTFQRLTTVYQILSNYEARELYDHHGVCWQHHPDAAMSSSSSSSTLDMDAFVLFAELFHTSSPRVSAYTGTLAMATMVDQFLQQSERPKGKVGSADDDDDDRHKEQVELLQELQQQQRQIDIAVYLRGRIYDFVTGRQNHEQYQSACQQEAHALWNQGGQAYVLTIGTALQQVANLVLEEEEERLSHRWIEATKANHEAKRRRILPKLTSMLQRAIQQSQRKTSKHPKTASTNDPTKNATTDETLSTDEEYDCNHSQDIESGISLDLWMQTISQPAFWKLLWEFHVDDVSTTVRLAARRLVWDDPGGDATARPGEHDDVRFRRQQQRAHALWILGNAFRNVATTTTFSKRERVVVTDYNATTILELLQAAFMASIPTPQDA